MTVVARPGAPETAGGGIRAKGAPGRLDLSSRGRGTPVTEGSGLRPSRLTGVPEASSGGGGGKRAIVSGPQQEGKERETHLLAESSQGPNTGQGT